LIWHAPFAFRTPVARGFTAQSFRVKNISSSVAYFQSAVTCRYRSVINRSFEPRSVQLFMNLRATDQHLPSVIGRNEVLSRRMQIHRSAETSPGKFHFRAFAVNKPAINRQIPHLLRQLFNARFRPALAHRAKIRDHRQKLISKPWSSCPPVVWLFMKKIPGKIKFHIKFDCNYRKPTGIERRPGDANSDFIKAIEFDSVKFSYYWRLLFKPPRPNFRRTFV